ncbi:LacI family DNA-binding transcriptional regulator [Marinicrinis sediminis]|uniref:LacI family DNA-binding transcriptional regulator n=1 Tax=Marinicrinis sediminis TaxID=1652465 RepID=A0ABW5RAD2_9BACL
MKRITMKDVALKAGVSTAAVSYVLNGKEGKVSETTLLKIQQAMAELNYIPDYSARSLASNRSNLIGVVIPQTEDQAQLLLENPFYSDLVCGIESQLRLKNYHLILSGVDKDKGYLDVSMQRNLDGAIIMGIYQEGFYEELKKVDIPIVLVDSYIEDAYFTTLGIDDEHGGKMATEHLLESGHTNIALVTGAIRKGGVIEKRYAGYRQALREANIFYNPDNVFEGSVSYEYGVEAGRLIAQDHPHITAVCATSDMVAIGVINGLNEFGKRVPDDISIIGFDDISYAKTFIPHLTTIGQHISSRGVMAAQLLIEAIEGKRESKQSNIVLPIELIKRDSVKVIP